MIDCHGYFLCDAAHGDALDSKLSMERMLFFCASKRVDTTLRCEDRIAVKPKQLLDIFHYPYQGREVSMGGFRLFFPHF